MDPDSVNILLRPCLYGVLVRMAVKPRWRLPVDLLRYNDACSIGRMSAGPTLVFGLLAAELPVIVATSSVA